MFITVRAFGVTFCVTTAIILSSAVLLVHSSEFKGNLWRANQEALSDEAILYSVRLPLHVQYMGDSSSFVKWNAPAHCVAQNDKSVETVISCNLAGLHKVKLTYLDDGETETNSRMVIMKKSPLCYRWYAVTLSGMNAGHDSADMVIRVWVWDPISASIAEIKHTAVTPSPFSEKLTKVFSSKGQAPKLYELDSDPRSEWDWSNRTFIASSGYWEIYINAEASYTRKIKVAGRPNIAAHGCFIRDTHSLILWPHYENGTIQVARESVGGVILEGQPGITMVIKDPCEKTAAFLIMSGKCLMTLDGFLSTSDVMVPSNILMGQSSTVSDIVLTTSHAIFLLNGSLLARERLNGTFTWLEVPDNLPLMGIQGKEWCQYSETNYFENSFFIGWNGDNLYVWQGATLIQAIAMDGPTGAALSYPLWLEDEHAEMVISYGGFTAKPQEVALLVRLTDDHQPVYGIIKWNIRSRSWGDSQPFFFSQKRDESPMSFMILYGAEENLIFWDDRSVYYSYGRGSDVSLLAIFNRDDDDDPDEIESSIKQMVSTVLGYVLVVSAQNILYSAQVYQQSLIQHFSLGGLESDLALYSNQIDELHLLNFKSGKLDRICYSLKPEIKTIVDQINPESCEYLYFEQCPQFRVYYLDVRDTAEICVELIHSAEVYNDILVIITIPEKVIVAEEVFTDFYPGRRSVKKILTLRSSFEFAQPANYSEAVDAATGFVTMEMKPQRLGIGCRTPQKMITNLELGCPPRRHIRIQKPAQCEPVGSFIVDKDAYVLPDGEIPEIAKEVVYDEAVYGCPVSVDVKENFKPIVLLYDDDTLVENMTANYVVWEDSGRVDFDYSMSMKDVGCLQEAQTWERMMAVAPPDALLTDIWGPHNYESCFVYEVTDLQLLKNSYQVLNESSNNQIQWRTVGDNNMFLFSVEVVDPYYSFCHLHTKFAAIVIGKGVVEDPKTPVLRISLGTFVGFTLSLLIISYFVYRRYHIQVLEAELLQNYEDEYNKDEEENVEESQQ